MGKGEFISPGDLDLVTITDDPQEAVNIILDYERRVGPPDCAEGVCLRNMYSSHPSEKRPDGCHGRRCRT